jgi:hypothetical protein
MNPEQELDLRGLRELLEKATPGPWFASDRKTGAAKIDVFAEDGDSVQTASHVARCGGKPPERAMLSELDGIWESSRIAREGQANAALIVAAVNALPGLLNEISRLRIELEASHGR